MTGLLDSINRFILATGFAQLAPGDILMLSIACVLLYLAIQKGFEPLLLLPIGFGLLLSNLPATGIFDKGGLISYFYFGIKAGVFPPLIFMGVGALTDFGPLLANPKTILLGAAAQFGIFATLIGSIFLGFNLPQAGAIGIIGGADGPTAIYTASKLAPELLGPIAVAAYSYMALVPIIQPPIMRALTTKEERMRVMVQLKEISKPVRILFPIVSTLLCGLLLPSAVPLIGMLMLGNLFRESGVVDRLLDTSENALLNIVTIFLGVAVGASMNAETFLKWETIGILVLGLIAFSIGTATGILFGKLMAAFSSTPINPLIGAAGVSAVPMAARVAQKVGAEENPQNFLLMHAMGPNVAGVIGSAIAAGVLLSLITP
ncbi:MAG: sodium ion-translocating decarboxylase subunit beta [Nitrospinaceae bacterium]|jgi:oxaloacetate decarboxylase beta subunit|nr:sodium ion-translocating decarboxylase subunit beta [Nitrospinaceae bacterium]MBT3432696.1 sodium ion-translocating decarboxylase subunit beta [Nitrospinaceae bacterium]MBT3821956.1 sodium ion-translocating decarboxylase subunit beta [Nitrospinaceae bacterium]MBT4094497.1 sodium ion-translocating decarboxylase subunit beta [Nitrospinaceae bacterium]MBT4429754.1 sodium ion-translocating decarboxylase subunit beta [Nitrospinaceae bacterium]